MAGRRMMGPEGDDTKCVALYHDMWVQDDFERCARCLFDLVRSAQEKTPGRRVLYLDIEGHRNDAGGFDRDAFEVMTHFLMGFLLPYLSEIFTPMFQMKNPNPQRNDLPDELVVLDLDGSHAYDHDSLVIRSREFDPVCRATRPSVRAIAKYHGLHEPVCLICWETPVERAHAVPESLGGSNDVRNFALLCPRHHSESPDVADAEAFWSWIDYQYEAERDSRTRRFPMGYHTDIDAPVADTGSSVGSVDHFEKVRAELIEHYYWHPDEFRSNRWGELMEEFHVVMDTATGMHFGIRKKASTEAWAFDVAKRRLTKKLKAPEQRDSD